jgi:hypothetical protein
MSELEKDFNAVGAPLTGLIRSTRSMPIVIPSIAIAMAVGVVIGRFFL